MNNPKVFIIILNFNSFEDTKECLISLEDISYNNYEIVVVDNSNSEEDYKKLKSKFSKHNIIRTDQNLGYANGNNIGIKFALEHGAEYICILNADVVVEKDFLKIIVDKLKNDKAIGIAGPCICEYNKRELVQCAGANISLYTGLTKRLYRGYKYEEIEKENKLVDFLGGACFVCRREVFEKIGLIPEIYFLFFEETEFCIKAKKAGYKLTCVTNSKIYHKGSSTISRFSGLSYYFLNRNRVVFIKRNSNLFQKIIFSMYIFIEAIGRIIIRREPFSLIKNFISGFKADRNSIDIASVNKFV
ncbi:glycosyltransferase family 2 protein [Clostridium hydrogenum]|uniref:glycosyltransferase family 2 protein n=1 Tax=Clostridium hydrogenum TaxID=2855764 RepID=UPI001F2923FF|nr:glycosyltransferase family 2 protein [Clostridium hydrogenum]